MSSTTRDDSSRRFGPFKLIKQVGCGAMGMVYKAKHPSFNGYVAVKIAHESIHQNPLLAKRFANEFAIGGRLVHPHLVNVLAHDVFDGFPYLVLEYVSGLSLEQHLKVSGPLTMEHAIALFLQIAKAVAFIHSQRMIHRDIKPANILLDHSGDAKLADLGLIKDQESDLQVTLSRLALGTPDYMAPEQFEQAKYADHRCDIYALACSLYVALSGKYPFGRGGPFQILLRKTQFQLTPLSEVLPNVSEAMDKAILSALHPRPEKRPDSVADFVNAITGRRPLTKPVATPAANPAAAPKDAADANRRSHERFEVQIPVEVAYGARTGQRRAAAVIDVSLAGLCLILSESAAIGSIIFVHFFKTVDCSDYCFEVRCCWARKCADGTWKVGCAFSQPLDDAGLEYLLRCGMSKTAEVEKPAAGQGAAPQAN